jgi:hypothetical protein
MTCITQKAYIIGQDKRFGYLMEKVQLQGNNRVYFIIIGRCNYLFCRERETYTFVGQPLTRTELAYMILTFPAVCMQSKEFSILSREIASVLSWARIIGLSIRDTVMDNVRSFLSEWPNPKRYTDDNLKTHYPCRTCNSFFVSINKVY